MRQRYCYVSTWSVLTIQYMTSLLYKITTSCMVFQVL